MKWFKSFSDGNGGFNTFDWSLGDSLTYGIIGFLLTGVFLLLFAAILPILLPVIYLFTNVKEKKIVSVISIILSLIYVINYATGFAFWDAANSNDLAIGIDKSLATIHACLIFVNIFLFLNAESIHNELTGIGMMLLILAMLFVMVKFFMYPNLYKIVESFRATSKYGTEIPKN